MDCERPLGMIHFSLILHHNMGMKYAEEPFNMGMCIYFFLSKASFKMGTFSDPQHTHPGIFILELPPPPGVGVGWGRGYAPLVLHCHTSDACRKNISPGSGGHVSN